MKNKHNFSRLKSAIFDSKSGGRAALLRKAVAPVTRQIDSVLSSKHKLRFDSLPKCVLICCPPRVGSTFIYQVLTRTIPCAYVANIHQLAPRLGSGLFPQNKAHTQRLSNFVSFYGHTRDLWDVNEGNNFLNYWFKDDIPLNIRHRFYETLFWLGASSDVPAIIKNVSVYERLSELHRAVPELLFIRIVRDPQTSIESSLRAYKDLGYLNPLPTSLDTSERDPIKLIITQIQLIEKRITSELANVPQGSVLEWSYEDFCQNPQKLIDGLGKLLGVTLDWSLDIFPFERSKRKRVSEPESQRIASLLKR